MASIKPKSSYSHQIRLNLLLVLISTTLFYAPLAAWSPIKMGEERSRSQEKSTEKIEETVSSISRLASSIKAGGDSKSPVISLGLQEISFLGSLAALTLKTKPESLELSSDPRSTWNSDSSPPIAFHA